MAEGAARAAVFDLDGTLIDSLPDIAWALNETLAEAGLPHLPDTTVRGFIGDGAEVLVARGFAAAGRALDAEGVAARLARFLAHYEPNVARLTRPFPNAVRAMEGLRRAGWRIGICTNKPTEAMRFVLRELALDGLVDAAVGGDDAPAKKPDGRHLAAVLDRLGVTARRAVMVGDAENDVACAREAGVPVICVSFGYTRVPLAELAPEAVVDDFADLQAVLERLVPGG